MPALLAGQDAREIVKRCVELDKREIEVARNYTFLQLQEQREFDGSGQLKKTESTTFDVTLLEGSPYRRVIARDGKPLSPKEEAKEQEKLRKSIEDRRRETPEQRSQRIAEWERKQEKQREPLREIPEAFDLKLAGEERIDGLETWMIDATPKAGYKPKSQASSIFPKVRARFWIDKQYHWVKVDMESLDTISFGGFLIRMGKGSHLLFENTRVNNEVWLPKQIAIRGSVRIALVKVFRGEYVFQYSNYRKFQTDSRVVTIGQ
jgi:hypothetical protein